MPEASGREKRRQRLATVVRQQAESEECWKRAEIVCRAEALRQTLADVGIVGDRAVATAPMLVIRPAPSALMCDAQITRRRWRGAQCGGGYHTVR